MTKTNVILFKPSGKYYTEENWEVPEHAIVPEYMIDSPDFHRIDGGPVLVSEDYWGYPCLFPGIDQEQSFKFSKSAEVLPKTEYNYGTTRMSIKDYEELVEKMKAPGYKAFQVLPPEPMSEQEKFFKALNEGKVIWRNSNGETTIKIKP